MSRIRSKGFTLAELLIALVILGEIATFTIPKILSAQQNGQKNAAAKETAAMISGAYQNYALANGITPQTKVSDLTQYFNYVKTETTGAATFDDITGYGGRTCSATFVCFQLHNGGIIHADKDDSFGGSTATNGLFFFYDPDGNYSGSTTGPGKGMKFILFYNGRLSSGGQTPFWVYSANDSDGGQADPSWFQW